MFMTLRVSTSFVLGDFSITVSFGEYNCEIVDREIRRIVARIIIRDLLSEMIFHKIYTFLLLLIYLCLLLLLSPLLSSILFEYKRIPPLYTLSKVWLDILKSYGSLRKLFEWCDCSRLASILWVKPNRNYRISYWVCYRTSIDLYTVLIQLPTIWNGDYRLDSVTLTTE